MKFRTEIEYPTAKSRIGYNSRIVALGSCFATLIGGRLREAKLECCVNPLGVLFNPLSICSALERLSSGRGVEESQLECREGRWFHFDFHGAFADSTSCGALAKMSEAVERGSAAFANCDVVLLTLGSAWVYEHISRGKVVANCHKLPAREFERRRLSVGQVVEALAAQIERHPEKRFILTVSPVRHLSDGLAENSLSKATLRVAAAELVARFERVEYFPAYETLVDDLRDYRFYADDMCHPSAVAVEYVWQKFCSTHLSASALLTLPKVEAIVRAAAHRSFDACSEAHLGFCRKQLELISQLHDVDLSKESDYFESCLQNNL